MVSFYPSRCLFAFVFLFGMVMQANSETLYRVRIDTATPQAVSDSLEKLGFDVMHHYGPNWVDVVVDIEAWGELERMGHLTEVQERGRPFYEIQQERYAGGLDDYPDLAEIQTAMTNFAANFPAICQLVDVTAKYGMPTTFEGRNLFAVKISDQVAIDEDEPNLLVVSGHHCREIVTPVIALDFIERLTSGYGVDPTITTAVDTHEIWIAPIWNPDGYHEVFVGDNLWRKNRRVFPAGTGVDLNRNYPFGFDTACSGSTSPSSITYKGPKAASEVETQTMITFSEDRRFAKVLDFHSFGSEVLFNYACLNIAPQAFWENEAIALANASGYPNSTRRPSADGEHYQWQIARMGCYAALTETHTEFQPSYASAQAEAAKVWPGLLYLFDQPLGIWGRVTDAATGDPLEVDIASPDANFANGETFGSGGLFGRYYHFVPPGTYTLTFSKDGFQPHTETVTLQPNTSLQLDVELVGPCPGDFDGSGEVSIFDMITIINTLGQSGVPQDVNNDGIVNLADLEEIMPQWFTCGAS